MMTSSNIWILDPTKVKNFVVFCGANDVDNLLSIHRSLQSDIVDAGEYRPSEHAIRKVKFDFSQLVDFLHNWSSLAIVNILNVLPRASLVRNQVINILNGHIIQLSHSKNFVKFLATEIDRFLFSFKF